MAHISKTCLSNTGDLGFSERNQTSSSTFFSE